MAIAALTAGCGADQSGSQNGARGANGTYTVDGKTYTLEASTTIWPAGITKAHFLSRVNQICDDGWKMLAENASEYKRNQDPALSRRQRVADLIQHSVLVGLGFHIYDTFTVVGAPKGGKATTEEIAGLMRIAIESGKHQVLAYSTGGLIHLFSSYNRRARAYGLTSCVVSRANLPPL